jgi:hypothetical protein
LHHYHWHLLSYGMEEDYMVLDLNHYKESIFSEEFNFERGFLTENQILHGRNKKERKNKDKYEQDFFSFAIPEFIKSYRQYK